MSLNINEQKAAMDRDAEKERLRLLSCVREKFAKYGDQVCEYMQTAVQHDRGAERIMSRLGLPIKSNFDKQIASIVKYINSHGPEYFMQRVKPGKRPAVNDSLFGETVKTTINSIKPKANEIPSDPMANFDGPLFDAPGNYIGPERRANEERRASIDRRRSCEVIRSNKRFFGDRRQETRRKSDREKMVNAE